MKTDKNTSNKNLPQQKQQKPKSPKKKQEPEKKKYTAEELAKLEQERQKRIKNEKQLEKENQKIYEEILEEAKKNNFRIKPKKEDSIPENVNIKISEKKAQTILEEGGMLDAYKYLIVQLCKNGLPTGNLFEYSAYVIKNYEKKWKEKKSKIMKENIEKYWEEKEKKIKEGIEKSNKKNRKILNRSLDEIEMKKYIKTLDRSRSSRGIKPLRKPIEDKNNPSSFKKRNKTLNKNNTNNQSNQNKKNNENVTNVKSSNKKDNKGKK